MAPKYWATSARQFFRYAVRKKLIADNPFEEMKVPSQENPSRLVEVPRAAIEKLLTSIQCPELRLMVALARYIGLRVPSEISHLRWRTSGLSMRACMSSPLKRSIMRARVIERARCCPSWYRISMRCTQNPAIQRFSSLGNAGGPRRTFGQHCFARSGLRG